MNAKTKNILENYTVGNFVSRKTVAQLVLWQRFFQAAQRLLRSKRSSNVFYSHREKVQFSIQQSENQFRSNHEYINRTGF